MFIKRLSAFILGCCIVLTPGCSKQPTPAPQIIHMHTIEHTSFTPEISKDTTLSYPSFSFGFTEEKWLPVTFNGWKDTNVKASTVGYATLFVLAVVCGLKYLLSDPPSVNAHILVDDDTKIKLDGSDLNLHLPAEERVVTGEINLKAPPLRIDPTSTVGVVPQGNFEAIATGQFNALPSGDFKAIPDTEPFFAKPKGEFNANPQGQFSTRLERTEVKELTGLVNEIKEAVNVVATAAKDVVNLGKDVVAAQNRTIEFANSCRIDTSDEELKLVPKAPKKSHTRGKKTIDTDTDTPPSE